MNAPPVVSVWVPGVPVPQGSKRHVGAGRMVESNADQLRPWRAAMTAAAADAIPDGWDSSGPMMVQILAWLPRPKNHYRADGSMRDTAPVWVPVRPDGDKLARAVLDACTDAGIWIDDGQVARLEVSKLYARRPGMQLDVHRCGS